MLFSPDGPELVGEMALSEHAHHPIDEREEEALQLADFIHDRTKSLYAIVRAGDGLKRLIVGDLAPEMSSAFV